MVGFVIPANIKSPAEAIYKSVYAVGPSQNNGQKLPKIETDTSDHSSEVANTEKEEKIQEVSRGPKGRRYVYEIETETTEDETKDSILSSEVEKDGDGTIPGEENANVKEEENKMKEKRAEEPKDYAIVVEEEAHREGAETKRNKLDDYNKKAGDYAANEETTKSNERATFPVSTKTTKPALSLNIAI